MGIYREHIGTAKVVTGGNGGITTWSPNEIALRGNVLDWHVNFSLNTAVLTMLGQIRIKAFGQTLVDLERDQLRAFLEYTNASNFVPATAGVSAISIPANLRSLTHARDIAARDPMDWRTSVAFPIGGNPQIDIIGEGAAGGFTAGATNTAILSWTWTDKKPTWYRRLTRSKLNFSTPGTLQKLSIQTSGELRGIIIPTLGLARVRLVLNGIDAFNMPGQRFNDTVPFDLGEDPLSESLRCESPLSLTNPVYIPVPLGMPAGAGSYIEMDTATNWSTGSGAAGQSGADQIVLDELVTL